MERSEGSDSLDDSSDSEHTADLVSEIEELKEILVLATRRLGELEGKIVRASLGGAEESADDWGPNEGLRRRLANAERDELLALEKSGELISAQELCELRGFSKPALSQAIRGRRIFFVQVEKRRLFPRFFGGHTAERRHIAKVCQELGSLPGMVKLHFFRSRKVSLGGLSPLEALANGDFEKVMLAARTRRDI